MAETEAEVAAVDGVVDVAVVIKWSTMVSTFEIPTVNHYEKRKRKEDTLDMEREPWEACEPI